MSFLKKVQYVLKLAVTGALIVCGLFVWRINSTSTESTVAPMVADEIKVGQNFVVGINGTKLNETMRAFLTKVKPGGLILYREPNIENTEQLTVLIKDLQTLAKETTGKPYFIFIDEEPAGATRLDLFEEFRKSKKADWGLFERDIKKMAAIGINANLAPVADFTAIDGLFMSKRSPLRNVNEFVEFNTNFLSLMKKNGVYGTLKHFPGIGVLKVDSHKEVPYFNDTDSRLEQSLGVFQEGINAGAQFVMMSHCVYVNIDPKNSASFSRSVIDILRGKFGFQGMIITDDVSSMPFIIDGDSASAEVGIKAIEAGNTMVLFSRKATVISAAFDSALGRYRVDPAFRKLVDSNYSIISKYKDAYNQ